MVSTTDVTPVAAIVTKSVVPQPLSVYVALLVVVDVLAATVIVALPDEAHGDVKVIVGGVLVPVLLEVVDAVSLADKVVDPYAARSMVLVVGAVKLKV